MNLFSVLAPLLTFELASASASASANSTLLRGPALHDRHLLQDSSCTLFRQDVTYEPTEDHPNGHEEQSWVCELTEQDTRSLNAQFVEVVESAAVAAVLANATSGASMMRMSEAIVDNNKLQIHIPENARVEVRNDAVEQNGSRSSGTIGTLKTLVVRLTDGNNVPVDASADQLKKGVFDNSPSLKTQMEACSYGQLEIEPFIGDTQNEKYIGNGVVDVKMDYSMVSDSISFCRLKSSAVNAAYEQLGSLSYFDLVMFCVPPGNYFFSSFGCINSRYSFYNNERCGSIVSQMHEVGHSIGLDSSETKSNGGQKSDGTGFMGSKYDHSDQKMCYNPQKNYQLGWYGDKVETINPLDGAGERKFVLNGVSDYKMNGDALVVVRLEQLDEVQDYYVGFNCAQGINTGTNEDRNLVTIVRKEEGAPDEYGLSMKVASLMPGDRHVINGFNGQEDVEVVFLSLENGDAKIAVIGGDTTTTTTACKDEKKKKEKFKRKENSRKRTCKFYAKKKKCGEKILIGMDLDKFVWEVCKKTCNRCGA